MHFLTNSECEQWADGAGYTGTAHDMPHISVRIPSQSSHVAFSRRISACLEPRSQCLLWVVEHGVWPSSENWHLYYRVRQSYGEQRLLHEAPGHLFLDYEAADLITYLQLALDSGWDVDILPRLTYGEAGAARAFVSHDEFAILAHKDPEILAEWREQFKEGEG